MGNLFVPDTNEENYYYTCYKCNDSFKNHCGGYSKRTSCRYHNIDSQTNTCNDCREIYKPRLSANCYHIKKKSVWWF